MTQPHSTDPAPEPAATPQTSVAPPISAKARSHKRILWIAAGCCGLVALALALHARQPQVPAKLPDPVASSQVVPIPGKTVDQRALVTPIATTALPSSSAAPAPSAPLPPPPPAESNAARDQQQAATSDSSKDILDALQRNADAMASLEQGIVDLKAQVAKLAQASKPQARGNHSPARSRVTPARSGADTDSAQLLSIDLWGGKPSVVVGRNRGDGTEVTFLNEGEKQGRVTVKRADVGSQRAVLGTDRGDVVLGREE